MKDKRFSVLLTAFQGTSAEKIIRDFADAYDKLILVNDKKESVNQLISAIDEYKPDVIINFGQKPVIKNKIYIELRGKETDKVYQTTIDVEKFQCAFEKVDFDVCISYNAGTSYCNHLYANGLKYLEEKGNKAKMVFIHVPFEKNMSDLGAYIVGVKKAIEMFCQI